MSGNSFGELFRVTTFGESHGAGLGVVIDGVPAGLEINTEFLRREMNRRRPGGGTAGTTARSEADLPEILSGVFEGRSTGTPLAILIRNTDHHSSDYSELAELFRPGHADLGYSRKFGIRDWRGGGRSSGRETAARVAAGAVAKLLLAESGVTIRAGVTAVGTVEGRNFDFDAPESNPLRALDPDAVPAMLAEIDACRRELDSVGGTVACRVDGIPAGWGEPVFDKLDALLAHAILSIGAVKAIEFGEGFAAARLRGSANNDSPLPDGSFATHHAGGVLGGISNGDALEFRIAVKPTPSIARPQRTIDAAGNEREITIGGRHDVCIAPRIVPVVEAMTAITLADLALRQRCARL